MREEIIGGLRNALERGSSLEDAVQSFINSGYNPTEVKEAASMLTSGATTIINSPQPQQKNPTPTQQIQTPTPQQTQNTQPLNTQNPTPQRIPIPQQMQSIQPPIPQTSQKRKSNNMMIILLTLFLVILLTSAALVFLYKDEVLKLLSS